MAGEDETARPPGGRTALGVLADQAWLLLMVPALCWAGNAIAGRAAAAAAVPPIGLVFWRWTLATILALPLAWPHLKRDVWPMLRAGPMMLLLALFGVSLPNALVYWALNTVSAINSVMLSTTQPVLIVLTTFLLFGQRPSRRQGLGVAVSLCGTLVMVAHGDVTVLTGLRFTPGDLLLLGAVVSAALYAPLLRLAPPVHPFSFLFASFLLGALTLLPFYLGETFLLREPVPLRPAAFASIAYIAIFPSILAYLAFNRAIVLLGPTVAGLTIYIVPVFGVALSALLLGELPEAYHFAGIALIATGVLLATRRKPG